MLPDKPWTSYTPYKDREEFTYEDGTRATRYPDGRVVVIPPAVEAPKRAAAETPPSSTGETQRKPARLPRVPDGKPVIDLPLEKTRQPMAKGRQ